MLARYVQMATGDGTTQAIFPEGGLSLDGRVGPAKLGLLGYIVAGVSRPGGRDVVFVPVGLAYDRVLEDRVLVEAAPDRRAAVPGATAGDPRLHRAHGLAQAARPVPGLRHGGGGLRRAAVAARADRASIRVLRPRR